MKSAAAVSPKVAAATDPSVVRSSFSAKTILLAAVSFGLVTGLVEGASLWLLQQVHGLARERASMAGVNIRRVGNVILAVVHWRMYKLFL